MMGKIKVGIFSAMTLVFGYSHVWASPEIPEDPAPCCSDEGCCSDDSCCEQGLTADQGGCCPEGDCCGNGDCCGGGDETCEP